ncbi:MAG: malic enzyme-like NAD(P)-binding protein [Oscillospiraceae bacterium]
MGKNLTDVKAVVNGAGSAGIAVTKLLMAVGQNVRLCDKAGAIYRGMPGLTDAQAEMAEITNPENKQGTLGDVIEGADVFLGFSAPGCLKPEFVKKMAKDAVIFACANPTPEIFPDEALPPVPAWWGQAVPTIANQINNVMVFPGIFRGAFRMCAPAKSTMK